MDSIISRAARITLVLSLGLWVGALVGFAFFFAPPTFAAMGPTPQFAALIAGIIEHLTDLGYVCAVLAFVALAVLLRSRLAARTTIAAILLVGLMTALSWFEASSILPQMKVTAVKTPAYAGLHRRSSTVYGTVLILGVMALSLAAVRRD
jgi:fucose 4-O-acetylase-like acetyltransferase